MSNFLNIFSKLILLVLLVWFSSCQSEKPSSSDSQWTEITIKLDGQMISIINSTQLSGWNRISVPKDSVEMLSFTQSQLDSVYQFVNSIIEGPAFPDHLVTPALAENVSFEIACTKEVARSTRTTTSRRVEFQFIKSWKELSTDTKGLSIFLEKNVYLIK